MELFRYWFYTINCLALIKREFETMEESKNRIDKGAGGKKRNWWKDSLMTGEKRPTDLHIDPRKMSTSL